MNKYRKHLKAALITGLGYGLGFVIGIIFIELVLSIGLLESIANDFENQRLYVGLFILFSVVVLGGALAGAIGGLILSVAVGAKDRKRRVARSALGIGIGFGVVLLPIMGLVAMLAMYNAGDASPAGFVIAMGVVGAIFGLVAGLMTGTIPAKINFRRVTGMAALAFGLGGIAFGFGLWHYFYTLYESGAATFELLLAFFVFGGVGGCVLGWIFSLDQEQAALVGDEDLLDANALYRASQWFKETKFYRKRGFWGTLIFITVLFLLSRLIAMSPLSSSDANLSDYLPSNTIGVHWSAPWVISNSTAAVRQPSLAQAGDLVAVSWEQDREIYLSTGKPNGDTLRVWQQPLNLSESPNVDSLNPQIAVDSNDRVHIVWEEALAGETGTSTIFYRSCLEGECTDPVSLSAVAVEMCVSETNLNPTISVNGRNILVVWGSNSENLPYASWQLGSLSSTISTGCALAENVQIASNPNLVSHPNGGFVLAFDNGTEVFVTVAEAATNSFRLVYQETGRMPELLVDHRDVTHAVWCGADGQIRYREEGTLTKIIPESYCLTRPTIGEAADGIIHVLWHANQVEQPSGRIADSNLIYQSRLKLDVWSAPIVVGLSTEMAQPSVVTGPDSLLHLAWDGATGSAGQIIYANYQPYECENVDLNAQVMLALEVAQSGVYRPAEDLVPFCQNRFDDLLILPEADPAYSDIPTTLNGAFDQVSDLIQTAQYEVLLSTMWYESDTTNTSPGIVLAEGVKGLYDQVKANPERYPRGMTVRILLDNPPEFTLSNLISQLWNVFNHMRFAGVPTMSDPEIGWNLEVANYDGSWPHGHTKMVVIDGKTAVAAGFNFQHKHQSKNHPSGKGKDDFDLGIQMTGPVAQATQLAFDDLWYGSNLINCPDLDSDSPLWWLTCRRDIATPEHVPEAQKYYLAQTNSNAFSLHRTKKFNEADVTIAKIVGSAEETMDVLQVNFTLKLVCDLNVLFRVCDFSDALDYMNAMMDAIETKGVKTRVLIKKSPIEAVESNIAVKEFRRALAKRSLSELVEFRYFNDSVHAKAVLIDEQFLLIGSQNFHYSAWGDGSGLTEFSIGTDDPDAIADFKRFFEFHWENGTPVPEK